MTITTILNCYRRPHLLQQQLDAILAQSIKSEEIWVWVNDHEDNRDFNFDSICGADVIVRSSRNFKFHSRFALALLARTEYVSLLDDDTIPGTNWYKNCLDTMEETPGIMGGVGIILLNKLYHLRGYPPLHDRRGWPYRNEKTEEVDLVGHAWFLTRNDLNYIWREVPENLDNCEDIQLSVLAQKWGGRKTYCPPHPASDLSLWSSLDGFNLGTDAVASSIPTEPGDLDFLDVRNNTVIKAIDAGWRTVRGIAK